MKEIVVMKKSILVLFLLGFGVLFNGCGTNLNGTYSGTESASVSGMAAVSSQVNLVVNSGTSSNLTGTYNNSSGGSSLTGTVSSDGSTIQNVSVNIATSASSSTVNGIPSAGCGGVYTGNLSIANSNSNISGTLTLTQPSTTTTTGTTTVPTSGCMGATRNINLTKQ